MKFCGGVRGGKRNKWLDFDRDPDHHADCPNLEVRRYGVMSCLGHGGLHSLRALVFQLCFWNHTNVSAHLVSSVYTA